MAFSYLNEDNIFKLFRESKDYTEKLRDHYPELQRIARNRPYEGGDPDFPSVTDGTTASIVQKTPKRAVQQIPTGVIETDDDNAWLPIVAQFVYENKILPYANEDYSLFEKSHLVIEAGLSFGSACTYSPFLSKDGNFCSDLTIPYYGDVFIQPGKKSARSSKYLFLRSWWSKEDIEALIEQESKLTKEAKKRGEKYEPTWDIPALKEAMESTGDKDAEAKTPHENERGVSASAVELVTGFQSGVGAKFFTFHAGSKKIVRRKTNKDPRGKMPLQWYFGDIDGTNPLGRGIVELIGGLQNLIDSDMQMYQYNRALMLAPPVIKMGRLPNFQYKPNVVLETDDPTAKIVPLTIDTTAVAQYPQLYGLQKSQLLNLVNSPDTSISADVGNPGFSKTPAGINQQKAAISVDDNAVRKGFEAWFEEWSEDAVNLYFAERSGIDRLQLDKETADKLKNLAEEGKFDLNNLNENNEILLNYDDEVYTFKFRVDASTSRIEDGATQLAGLELIQKFIDGSPSLRGMIPPEKQLAIYNGVVDNSGVEDPENLKIDIDDFLQEQQMAQEEQMMQEQAQAEQQAQMSQEPQLSELDQQLIMQLERLGLPTEIIQEAIQMLEQGATDDQVLMAIGQYQRSMSNG